MNATTDHANLRRQAEDLGWYVEKRTVMNCDAVYSLRSPLKVFFEDGIPLEWEPVDASDVMGAFGLMHRVRPPLRDTEDRAWLDLPNSAAEIRTFSKREVAP